MKRSHLSILLILFLLAWIAGCSRRDETLVQVGPKDRITVSEFKKGFDILLQMDYQRSRPDTIPMSRFREHLEGLIDNRLILLAAYEAKVDQDSIIRAKVEEEHMRKMLSQLYDDIVMSKAVPEKDIRDFWKRSDIAVSCRKIEIHYPMKRDSAADKAQYEKAREILARAKKGESFSQLARQYSDDRVSAQKGGAIGPLWYNATGDPIIEAAFSLKEGQISDLIKIPNGWAILKVDKIEEKNKRPYREARLDIRDHIADVRRQKREKIAREYLEKLEKKHQATFNEQALDSLAAHFRRWKSSPVRPNLLDSLKALPESFLKTPLYTSREETIRVSDLISVFENKPSIPYRGKFEQSKPIRDFLYSQYRIQARMLEEEARRLGYAKHPVVLEKLKEFKEREMISRYLNLYVYAGIKPDSEAVRFYYQTHLADRYSTPEKVRVQEVQVYTKRKVDEVLQRLKKGEDMGKIAAEWSLRGSYRDKKGILPDITRGSWGSIGEKAFQMKPGEIAVVELGDDKYSVIKLLAYIPATPKPFREVAASAERALTRELMEQKKAEWLKARREELGVFVDEKALERLWRSYIKTSSKA